MSQLIAQPVHISYNDLVSNPSSLQTAIASAFGSKPGCLGIIVVNDLPPQFPALRKKLFYLAHALANLPEETRETLARPETSYLFGWSHGKEVMNGRPDTMKGSFYANPLLDIPAVDDAARAAHPEYYAGNVWPNGIPGLESFEEAFKSLGRLVADVGLALARACEGFVSPDLRNQQSFASLIEQSMSNKARLLHYYPEPSVEGDSNAEAARVTNDSLCGTHLDHSLLTGLCSAMYLTPGPTPVPPPSSTAGLYIYPRNDPNAVKVEIPVDCLAFQTGEALEVLTAGRLAATPHFVSGNACSTPAASNVSRETYALFLQPDVDDVIGENGETFGQFTKRVLGRHYADLAAEAAD